MHAARAAGWAATLGLVAASALAGSVQPATDAALVTGTDSAPAAQEQPAAPEAAIGLDPTVLRTEIDLLLDLQADTVELGATPADGPSTGALAGAVDPWVLSPGLPANPHFPGVGLSFELPATGGRISLGDPEHDDLPAAPAAWSSAEGGRFGRLADGPLAEPITELRSWVATHRTALLVGLGAAALVIAAFTALTRPPVTAGADRARRHRRRRRSGRSDGDSSGFASITGARAGADDPSTLPATEPGTETRPPRRRRRRSVDPATHRR